MITNISIVSVWVKDIDESLAFYTDVLGFVAKDDIQLGPDFRWCTVCHPSQPELQVHLTTPSKPLSDELIDAMVRAPSQGGLPGIGLQVDDCRATYDELVAKGVESSRRPRNTRRRRSAHARQLGQLDGARRAPGLLPRGLRGHRARLSPALRPAGRAAGSSGTHAAAATQRPPAVSQAEK